MDSGAVGWLIKTADKNFWRVEGYMTRSDLVQDGYACYLKVVENYKGKAKNKAHLMSLFKTTFTNHIHDLANKRRKHMLSASLEGENIDLPLNQHEGFLWENAPPLIQQLFDTVAAHPNRANWKQKRKANGTRETTTEWLSRIMGGVTLPDEFHLLVREHVLNR